jgi:hypothetical protein
LEDFGTIRGFLAATLDEFELARLDIVNNKNGRIERANIQKSNHQIQDLIGGHDRDDIISQDLRSKAVDKQQQIAR